MQHKGIEYEIAMIEPGLWKWQFRIGAVIKSGQTKASLVVAFPFSSIKAAFGRQSWVWSRLVLSDAAWKRMAPLIIGRPDQKGSTGRDNRMFVEGVLSIRHGLSLA